MSHNKNTLGKLLIDDAGHLIADRFGGSNKLDNLVSQSKYLNRAQKVQYNYNSLEREWAKALKNKQKITNVNIELTYAPGSTRPSSFMVSYYIDNKYYDKKFTQQ